MDFSVKLLNVGEKMDQQQHPEKNYMPPTQTMRDLQGKSFKRSLF